MGQIEGDQVMAKNKGATTGECIEFLQCCKQLAMPMDERFPCIATHGCKLVNALIVDPDFEIDRDAAW
ncbi:hypothetical protein [Cupriavidus sp. D39]|uniref:hypothetical protein n=1 Tax=Cupriavidus sp. D39 TaxID=2997877 RepID=UPI00227163A9|nr:hypothetical protein [Cupriavidus sp. D39]MCY0857152.1 hypothetical protein [Cupriavidus sp. D39]